MKRAFNGLALAGICTGENLLQLSTPSRALRGDQLVIGNSCANPFYNVLLSDMHLVTTTPGMATISDFGLTNDFFGSYTHTGVLFTWAKANNWP